MKKQIEFINPPEWGKCSGFSHGVKTQPGSLLFVAGQIGRNEEDKKIVGPEFAAQFDQALSNVITVVRRGGGGPENIVRLTIYVLDRLEYIANLKPIGEAYRRHMGKHYPAMTLAEVKGLLVEDSKLELEATAVL
jgi:enamine deaminase RidA (YjgF/YER057c/UK114 family)